MLNCAATNNSHQQPIRLAVKLANYFPAKGVPKIPTASSAQIRRKIIKRTRDKIVLFFGSFTFLEIKSYVKTATSKSTAATMKSAIFQLTSSVNCMAISGISNKTATVVIKIISRLLFMILGCKMQLKPQ